jgi:hypothetical protein
MFVWGKSRPSVRRLPWALALSSLARVKIKFLQRYPPSQVLEFQVASSSWGNSAPFTEGRAFQEIDEISCKVSVGKEDRVQFS